MQGPLELAELYVAVFNRAPDAAGLEYWVDRLNSGMSLEAIASNWMHEQPEAFKKYPASMSGSEFISNIYQNVLGREPDEEGLAYWLEQVESGALARDLFVAAVINGAKDNSSDQGRSDAALLNNRAEVGIAYAAKGLNDTSLAEIVLRGVSAANDSVAATLAVLDFIPEQEETSPDLLAAVSATLEAVEALVTSQPQSLAQVAEYLNAVASSAGSAEVADVLEVAAGTLNTAASNPELLADPSSLAEETVREATGETPAAEQPVTPPSPPAPSVPGPGTGGSTPDEAGPEIPQPEEPEPEDPEPEDPEPEDPAEPEDSEPADPGSSDPETTTPWSWKLLAGFNFWPDYSTVPYVVEKYGPFVSDGTAGGTTIHPVAAGFGPASWPYGDSGGWVVHPDGFATLVLHGHLTESSWSNIAYRGGVSTWISDGTVGGTREVWADEVIYGHDAHLALGSAVLILGQKGLHIYKNDEGEAVSVPLSVAANYPKKESIKFDETHDRAWILGFSEPYGREVYGIRYEGDQVVTARLVDVWPGEGDGVFSLQNSLVTSDGRLVFVGVSGHFPYTTSDQLWISDASPEGTELILDLTEIINGYRVINPHNAIFELDGALLITVVDGEGDAIWSVDSDSGAYEVIAGSFYDWSLQALGRIDSAVYYFGQKATGMAGPPYMYSALYKYEKDAGIVELGRASVEAELLGWNSTVAYFADQSTEAGRELWALDLETGVYSLILDMLPGSGAGLPSRLQTPTFLHDDLLFFSAYESETEVGTYFLDSNGEVYDIAAGRIYDTHLIAGGVVVAGEGFLAMVELPSDESSEYNVRKIVSGTDPHYDLIASPSTSFTDNAIYFVENDVHDLGAQLKRMTAGQEAPDVVFEGDRFHYKAFEDDTILISQESGKLWISTEPGDFSLVGEYEGGYVDLVGAVRLPMADDVTAV